MESSEKQLSGTRGVNIESVAKAVPLAIGFFILCGALYLDTYYRCFHINIFNYLDTTEILTTFLNIIREIIIILAFEVIYVLILKLIMWFIDWRNKKKNKNWSKVEKVNPTIFDKMLSKPESISLSLIILSLIFCCVYIYRSFSIEITSNYIIKDRSWMYVSLISFTLIAALWLGLQVEQGAKNAYRNITVFCALFFLSFSVSMAVERIEQTVNNIDLSSMVVVEPSDGSNKPDTIRTTPKYIYVGRTNKYVFFFNAEQRIADIIPQDKIKKISFRYQRP